MGLIAVSRKSRLCKVIFLSLLFLLILLPLKEEQRLFKGYAIGSARKHQQMEILELSIWSNSSSNLSTPNLAIETPIVQPFDRPSEFYRVGGYHHGTDRFGRQIQKLDLKKANRSWIELDNVAIPAHIGTTRMAVSVDSGRLFIFTGQLDYGGGPATRSSAYLNLVSKQWINLPDVPEARYTPSAVIANNHVHLFGGVKADGQIPSLDYWLLDLDDLDRGWFPGPSIPQSGAHRHVALIDDWIYAFAFEHGRSPVGINRTNKWDEKEQVLSPSEYLAQPRVFKIHSNSKNANSSRWIRLSDIPHPVSHATSIVLNDRWILLLGRNGSVSHVQLFDSYLDRWRSLSPLPIATRSPLLWMNEEKSMLYLQTCSSSTECLTYETHIIWSHQPKTERCLFYTNLNCTTRELQRTPFSTYDRTIETRWTRLFSGIYLLNIPKFVDRLRRTWSELGRMGLTSLTLFEAFRVDHIESIPLLIAEDLLWPDKIKEWRAKKDEKSIRHYVLSRISSKLTVMDLWTRNSKKNATSLGIQPVLIMEDDLEFMRLKEETVDVVERVLTFLGNHSEIEWDLLYLGYRNIEATRTYQISEKPPIHLWRTSFVLSATSFIVNQDRSTVERLNQCCFTRLSEFDQAIAYCLKSGFLRGYLIEPRLVQSIPGFSFALNHYQDYEEKQGEEHQLGNHTRPALFISSLNL